MSQTYDDFQSRAARIGKAFSTWCEITLQSIGFVLHGKKLIKNSGVEVDQVVTNRSGESIYFEFKGSSKPPRPGLQRTDTVKKALCNAFLLHKLGLGPYVVITSHKPKAGTSSAHMIALAEDVLFDVICISIEEDFERLRSYVHALPWRNSMAAKQQVRDAVALSDAAEHQLPLFSIGSLSSFNRPDSSAVGAFPRKREVK